jgi:hypothetical protein
LEERRTFLSI